MAVIKSTARFAASSEQQKLLQRNIHMQAMLIRGQLESEANKKRLATLEKFSTINAMLNPAELDSFIVWATAAVDRALIRANVPMLPERMADWDVIS